MEALPPPPRPRRLLSPWGVFLSVTFALLYLLPISWVGGAKSDVRGMPAYLQHVQRVACLFTSSVSSWKSYHIQVQRPGSDVWEEVESLPAFQLQIFGYRTRLHRILGHAFQKGGGNARTRELAGYIKDELEAGRGPTGEPVDVAAIRFVRTWHPVKELAKEEGRWKERRLAEIPKARWQVFGERRWDGKKATNR